MSRGRPSLGERKRSPFRLPPVVEAAIEKKVAETGLNRNDVAVLAFCEHFGVPVPAEYQSKHARLSVLAGTSGLASAA